MVRCFLPPQFPCEQAESGLLFFAPGRNSHRIPRNKRHLYSATVFLNLPHSRTRRRRKKNFPLQTFFSPSSFPPLLFLSAFEEYGTHEKRASHKPRGREEEKRELVWTITITLYDERRTDWKHRKKKERKKLEKEMRRGIFRAKFLCPVVRAKISPWLQRENERGQQKLSFFCGSCFARLQSA